MPKRTDEELVAEYMKDLEHPLKPEVEALRKIIKGSDARLKERIKWNAPSYYFGEDIVTFGPARWKDKILLVFHHPAVVGIKSNLLEGDYKDRRLAYFTSMNEIRKNKAEISRIVKGIVAVIDK